MERFIDIMTRIYSGAEVSLEEGYELIKESADIRKKPCPSFQHLLAISHDRQSVMTMVVAACDIVRAEYGINPLTDKDGRFIKFINR